MVSLSLGGMRQRMWDVLMCNKCKCRLQASLNTLKKKQKKKKKCCRNIFCLLRFRCCCPFPPLHADMKTYKCHLPHLRAFHIYNIFDHSWWFVIGNIWHELVLKYYPCIPFLTLHQWNVLRRHNLMFKGIGNHSARRIKKRIKRGLLNTLFLIHTYTRTHTRRCHEWREATTVVRTNRE